MKMCGEKNYGKTIDAPSAGAERFVRQQFLLEAARDEAQQNMRRGCSHTDFAQWQEFLLAVETAIRVLQAETTENLSGIKF